MRRQLRHLIDLSELPNVDLRVVPATEAYPAMGTPFYILSFDARYPDIGYVELLDKGIYLEEPDDVELYVIRFQGLRAVALEPDASRELIAAIGFGRA
ncbi:MAG TPA: Scr1 family TA system antitoxin-like transcriptional regulator, partial [Micromonosporaceae bacterium]|nr:Scr1 family TA system antitoxin-like transcriptional regulator [Micromonosporaceae bacterium]